MSLEIPKKIIAQAPYGMLATTAEGAARCRPMSFVIAPERFALWSSTWACSGKAAEMETDSRVEVCFVGEGKLQLRIQGIADLNGGEEKKARLLELNPRVRNHFRGPDDPNFVHIEIVPSRVRWMPPGFGEYTEVSL